jgi:Leucine-rich repeat (LRR) protein
MKNFLKFSFMLGLCLSFWAESFAQKTTPNKGNVTLSPEQQKIENYKQQALKLVEFFHFAINTMGDEEATQKEKDVIINETFLKYFRDNKVQIEDDLVAVRQTVTNKDVQAYLKDIEFFFKNVTFEFTEQKADYLMNEAGQPYLMVAFKRILNGVTIDDENLNNSMDRFVEINIDEETGELKIVSIYTTRLSEEEDMMNWWNTLPTAWRTYFTEKNVLESALFKTDFQIVSRDTLMIGTEKKKVTYDLINYVKSVVNAETLDLSGRKDVEDLTPLTKMANLKTLDVSKTGISDITPLRSMTKLEVFRCAETMVSDLSYLRHSLELRELNVNKTMITDLKALEGFTKLSMLSVSNCNLLKDISTVEMLTQLKDFRFSSTTISTLDHLKNLTQLEYLQFNGTPVAELSPLSNLKKLEIIQMDRSKVSSLAPLKSLPALKKIYCDNTSVSKDEANQFMQTNHVIVVYASDILNRWWDGVSEAWKGILKAGVPDTGEKRELLHNILNKTEIDITNNAQIKEVEALKVMTNLKILKMASSGVSNLAPLRELKDLREIDFSGTFVTDIEPLSGLTKLTSIKGNNSKVGTIAPLANLVELKSLEMDGTQIREIKPLSTLANLDMIYMDKTLVNDAEVASFYASTKSPECLVIYKTQDLNRWWAALTEEWKKVFADEFNIADLKEAPNRLLMHKIGRLQKLVLKTPVKGLRPLQGLPMLKTLNIADQRLTSLDELKFCTNLEVLHCDKNPVSDITPILQLTNLRVLDLSGTIVEKLDGIGNLKKLEVLKIAGTKVKDLEPLAGVSTLKELDCSTTEVKRLDDLFGLPNLKKLDCFRTKLNQKRVDEFKGKKKGCEVVWY